MVSLSESAPGEIAGGDASEKKEREREREKWEQLVADVGQVRERSGRQRQSVNPFVIGTTDALSQEMKTRHAIYSP